MEKAGKIILKIILIMISVFCILINGFIVCFIVSFFHAAWEWGEKNKPQNISTNNTSYVLNNNNT